MLDGRRFRLNIATVAVDTTGAHRTVVWIPAGDTIEVIGRSSEDQRMVDVTWKDLRVVMFAVDILLRGTEVRRAGA